MQPQRLSPARHVRWESQPADNTKLSHHQRGDEMWEELAAPLTTTFHYKERNEAIKEIYRGSGKGH